MNKHKEIFKINFKLIKKINFFGSGKAWVFISILTINFIKEINKKLDEKITLIIDEPETNLDDVLLKRISIELTNLLQETEIKIFIATHSRKLTNDILNIKNIYLKTPDYSKKNIGFFQKINIQNINEEMWTTKQQIINSFFCRKIIICEGNEDIKFLEKTIDELLLEKNNEISTNYMILPVFKKTNIKEAIKCLENYGNFKDNIFVLFDKDSDINNESKKCKISICSLNVNHKKENLIIEKLIDKNIYGFSKNIDKSYINSDEQTKEQIKNEIKTKLLNFLKSN